MKIFTRVFALAIAVLAIAAVAHAEDRDNEHEDEDSTRVVYVGGGGFGGNYGGGYYGGGFPGDIYGDTWGNGWHRGGYGRYPGCDFGGCETSGGYVGGTVACAPKTFEGNVASTDRVLKSLIASKDFSSATQFKTQVSKISAMKDPAKKATAYLKIAGINSNDTKAIVAFVGARNAKGAWITDLQRNANLTSSQAEVVASKLQGALRGGLQ